jgi:hypothetical protein
VGQTLSYVDIILIIYNENGAYDLNALFATVLDKIPDDATEEHRDALIPALQDAWNYFPHARHNGLSPAQMMAMEIGEIPPRHN